MAEEPDIITLSSDEEDTSPPAPVINRVVSLPAAESARQIATALSRAPKNLTMMKKGVKRNTNNNNGTGERGRDPNRVFSVRVRGDTSSEEEGGGGDGDDIQHVEIMRVEPEVVTVDDDDENDGDDEDDVVDGEVKEKQGTNGNAANVKSKMSSSSVTSNGSGRSEVASAISARSGNTDMNDHDDQRSEVSLASSSATATLTDCTQASKRELNRFCNLLKSRLVAKDCKTVSALLVNKYKKYVEAQPKEFHEKLAMKFASGIRKIQDGENEYTRIKKIKEYMKPSEARFTKLKEMEEYETSDDDTAKADREADKKKKITRLEKELAKMHQKILELDEAEVDFDNEDELHNSPYMLREKMIDKSMKVFYRLCEATKSLTKTGRPTQKKIKIESGVTNYPEFELAVQNFMNKGNHLFSPDFADIFGVVAAENKGVFLPPEMLHKIAVDLHKQVVLKIQERRKLDTLLAFPSSIDLAAQDPADNDPELARKLEENKTKGRTVDSVVEEFARRAATEQVEVEDDEAGGDDESLGDSEEETESENNNLEDVPLSAEYATGPEAECLEDDEDDDDVELPSQQSDKPVPLNVLSTEKSKENGVEVEGDADTGEPDAKKGKLV